MCEHHGFGIARRAGGVDQDGDLIVCVMRDRLWVGGKVTEKRQRADTR